MTTRENIARDRKHSKYPVWEIKISKRTRNKTPCVCDVQ